MQYMVPFRPPRRNGASTGKKQKKWELTVPDLKWDISFLQNSPSSFYTIGEDIEIAVYGRVVYGRVVSVILSFLLQAKYNKNMRNRNDDVNYILRI